MNEYRIYDNWKVSYFIKRINRFTILTRLDNNRIIKAYLPNTGRLQEHLIPENKIFLTKVKTPKFNYKAISTFYQDSFVLIDTIKLNRLFEIFLIRGLIEDFQRPVSIQREYSIKNRRFDFFIKDYKNTKNLVEVKSCTLCHNRIAMFPDAPSKRALSHISLLSSLYSSGYFPWIIFLISHNYAEKFIPNLHTDPNFSKTLINLKHLNTVAYKYKLINPIAVDLDSIKKIQIDTESIENHLSNSGSYLLILKNINNTTIQIGKLKSISFKKGYYVYVGSALNGIDKRIKRHYRSIKNKRWHIDYICPYPMKIINSIKIRRKDRLEDKIAREVMQISDDYINHFGSSDSSLPSHLFYFKHLPMTDLKFIKIILDFQTFTENLK